MTEDPQERFKEILGEHIDQARINDEKVLVLLFGHGIETSLDFSYYDWRSKIPEVPDIKSMVKSLVVGETKDVDIMVAAPSFYQGGWVYHPISMSRNSAAVHSRESSSSFKAGPSTRVMASVFTYPCMYKMTNKIEDDDDASDYEEMDEDEVNRYMELQQESNYDLLSYVHNILVTHDINDRIMHEFTFTALEDNWWHPRTGIPLDELQKQWNSLEDCDRDESFHPGDLRNSDPTVTAEQRAEFDALFKQYKEHEAGRQSEELDKRYDARKAVLGKRTFSAFEVRGGSMETLCRRAMSMHKMHHQNHPGFDDCASNYLINHTLRELADLTGSLSWNDEHLVLEAHDELDYRLSQIFLADRYLDALGMELPSGKTCPEFIEWKHDRVYSQSKRQERDVIYQTLHATGFGMLFPRHAPPGPRIDHNKACHFMLAAIFLSDLRLCTMKERLEALIKGMDRSVTETSNAMKQYGHPLA
jgi:hypothetical protein